MRHAIAGAILLVLIFGWFIDAAMAAKALELPVLTCDAKVTDSARSFVLAICSDRAGNLWTANEDGGVWRMNPAAAPGNQWTHFTTKDGLGDDYAYAIDCDNQGRVWVGHLNHGVSVYNGERWQNYDVLGGIGTSASKSGPIGDHVTAITVCRSTGDVWMATSAGLCRYVESSKQWLYYTRHDGLVSDQANAVTFDPKGKIYVATQSDGIEMAEPADNYRSWNGVNGPARLPTSAAGDGLACNRINDILVGMDGTLYAATPAGLSWSIDRGATWKFIRGKDWIDKLRGINIRTRRGFAGYTTSTPLAEDWVSSLAEDPYGYLWAGFRSLGLQRLQRTQRDFSVVGGSGTSGHPVKALLPSLDGRRGLAGVYGAGLASLEHFGFEPQSSPAASVPEGAAPALPDGAGAPSLVDLNAELSGLANVQQAQRGSGPIAVPLEDDWRTRGDWLGRYGRYWCDLCLVKNDEYLWGSSPLAVEHSVQLSSRQDAIQYLVDGTYTADPQTLELPSVFLSSRVKRGQTTWDKNRRQSEMKDTSERLSPSAEGPSVFVNLRVPTGTFVLSLYFVNNDGHIDDNGLRDYELILREVSSARLQNITGIELQPELAHSRVADFFGGVYKRFLVQGPRNYSLQIARPYSPGVTLSAIMLDQLDEHPAPYFGSFDDRDKNHNQRTADLTADSFRYVPATTEADSARLLVDRMELMCDWNPQWWGINHRRIAMILARWYQAHRGELSRDDQSRRTTCLYRAGLYAQWESCQSAAGLRTARDIEKALRWDGVSPASNGRGFELVTKYLSTSSTTTPPKPDR